jgi:hypothetical protein
MVEHERDHVQSVIHSKLLSGILPNQAPVMIWAARLGSQVICSACDQKIRAHDLEYEVEMNDERTMSFHQPCLEAWHLELMRLKLGEVRKFVESHRQQEFPHTA